MRNVNDVIEYVFLDVAIVIVVARVMGQLFRRFGQPAVVGEIIAGLMLGPTLLGALPGHLDTVIFPKDVRPYLVVLANLGLVLFMFIVGMEVNLGLVRGRGRIASTISLASVAVPFGIGMLLATVLYARHGTVAGHHVSFSSFALFLGVAMSITALPVLARMLADRGLDRTPIGVLSLACAVIDDVLAWTMLAVVVAVTVGGSMAGVARILLLTVGFGFAMALIVRPLLQRMVGFYARVGRLTPEMLVVVLAGTLLSAYVTEKIGIHFIFGAFLFGLMMPRQGAAQLTRDILSQLEQVSMLLLLPVFFVVTGLSVDVGAIGAAGIWQLALILLVAVGGKFTGAVVAARAQHVPRRQANALGVLMNTRGLTELVILQVGVQLGVIDGQMFTMLVIMAILTTVMTGPLLHVFYPERILQRDIEEAERAALGTLDDYTVLVVPGSRAGDAALLDLGCDLLGREAPARVVMAQILHRAPRLEVAGGLGVELAELAGASDGLRSLARAAEARGVTCTVQTRFGDHPAVDIADLATRTGASLVLVYEDWAGAPGAADSTSIEWPAEMTASVVTVAADFAGVAPGPVAAVIGTNADSRAVLRVAAVASLGRDADLHIVGGETRAARRAGSAAADALSRAGFPNATASPDAAIPAGTTLVVLSADAADLPRPSIVADGSACVTIRAHAGSHDADSDLEEIAARFSGR